MDENNLQKPEKPSWAYLALPLAIIIAGVMVSGSVLYANNRNRTAQIGSGGPKTGTIQYGVAELKAWAKTIKGLDRQAFNECLDSGKYRERVEVDRTSGVALGVQGTPTFFLNGQKIEGAQPIGVFRQALDQAQASSELIEYSDFQCPFCRSFFNETLPIIQKEYIDAGKITLVYRHFPLDFHPAAQKSAEAAECAREQGKFWEMHDAIFTEQVK